VTASEDDILNFAASAIGSIWALELLLLLKQEARSLSSAELMRQLRGSEAVIAQALERLHGVGLIAEEAGRYRYRPASPEPGELAEALDSLYRSKPVTVVSAIANAPRRKLQILSDAFRLKKD
jgi:predicted transcriptional regulator